VIRQTFLNVRKKEIWLLAVVLLWGGILRLNHLGTMFLNRDEPFFQIRISFQPLAYVLKYNNGPLFSLLVHFLLPLGRLEIMARLVSFVSGLLIIVMTYLLGKAMVSRTAGLCAALFVSCNHLLIFYSQNSRSYALLTLLFLISAYSLYRAAGRGAKRHWVFYGISLVFYLYTHTVALLSLPGYALFIGFVWMEGRKRKTVEVVDGGRPRTLRRFILSTGAAAGIAALLYVPCAWMTQMLFGSLGRGISAAENTVALSLRDIQNTLQLEISPLHAVIFFLTMGFLAVGLFARFKTFRRESIFILGAIVIPWSAFVLGKPQQNDVNSLYRYLQHLLPLVFIAAARGIEVLGSAVGAVVARTRPRLRSVIAGVLCAVLALVLAGEYFSNLGGYYYSDYWREGSFRFDPDVAAYLRQHADRDAMLYIDSYPVSSTLLIVNPLAKDLHPEETIVAIRENYIRPAGAGEVLIHDSGWAYFYWSVAATRIELWAVTPKTSEPTPAWRSLQEARTDLEVTDLKSYTLLHFKKDSRSVAEKMSALADLLLTAPDGDAIARRQHLLFAARIYFMTRDIRDGIRIMREFEVVAMDEKSEAANGGTWVDRGLGRLLGFSPRTLRDLYERRALEEIQSLLYKLGNDLSDAGRLTEAALAFEEVQRISGSYDSQVVESLVALGDRFEKAGDRALALKTWETAANLDRNRKDITDRIAKVRALKY
jgi:tetratricopeptide (TPR) repeat protein